MWAESSSSKSDIYFLFWSLSISISNWICCYLFYWRSPNLRFMKSLNRSVFIPFSSCTFLLTTLADWWKSIIFKWCYSNANSDFMQYFIYFVILSFSYIHMYTATFLMVLLLNFIFSHSVVSFWLTYYLVWVFTAILSSAGMGDVPSRCCHIHKYLSVIYQKELYLGKYKANTNLGFPRLKQMFFFRNLCIVVSLPSNFFLLLDLISFKRTYSRPRMIFTVLYFFLCD